MTELDIQVDDTVVIEAKVVGIGQAGDPQFLQLETAGKSTRNRMTVYRDRITSVKERPLKVGDRVVHFSRGSRPVSRGLRGEILALYADQAWVKWDDYYMPTTYGVDRLKREQP